jgi:hypothetical protein
MEKAKLMSRDQDIRRSRRLLGELLGLAPCPAPAPHLFQAIVDAAPRPDPAPRWRQTRFAAALAALALVAVASVHIWNTTNDESELADVDELAAASLLVL